MIPTIDLGPVELQTFGLMFALAFVASGWVISLRLRELSKPVDWSYEIMFAAAFGGIVGAKLWFSVQTGDWAFDQIFSGTGLVWFGGAFGGTAAVVLYARYRSQLGWWFFDMAAPALAVGYAVGRIGCQLSGDGDYGKVSDLPWAMGYPDGTVPTPPGVEVQPTPVYETVSMLLIAGLLWRLRNRFRPGVLFGIYLVFSSIERFLVEFARRNETVAIGLTDPQLVSLALIAIGAVIWWQRSQAPAEAVNAAG